MGAARTLGLGLLGCLLLIPLLHGQDLSTCAWGWVLFEDGCYSFFSQELSWRRAEGAGQRGAGAIWDGELLSKEVLSPCGTCCPHSGTTAILCRGSVRLCQAPQAFCQRFGADAHLASVHSAEELQAITTLLHPRPSPDSEEEEEDDNWEEGVWIGLHHPLGSRHWQWSDGSKVDYGSWHQQPSPGRACAALQDTADFMTWHGDICADRKPFVCKARS